MIIICRFDTITILTILAYFADCPAYIHFAELTYFIFYYRGTLRKGLTYCRRKPFKQLKIGTFLTKRKNDLNFPFPKDSFHLCTYFDTSYAPTRRLSQLGILQNCPSIKALPAWPHLLQPSCPKNALTKRATHRPTSF